ncbi:unnamed protein product [Allacma fusca]|nr:unnamed protein product [Allacma fusca]
MGGGSIWIIKEIYDAENSCEKFECELDLALKKGISTIVIEPPDLAEQTGRWITVGNFFHKTAVIFGLSSILWFSLCPRQTTVYTCLTGCSVLSASLYTISWQSDPCCKYQVEKNTRRLSRLEIPTATTAVVFRKRDNKTSDGQFPICRSK